MFGRTVNFPTDENIELGVDPRYTVDEETYLQAFRENLENILDEARNNIKIAQERQKLEFDKRPAVTEKKFAVGEKVMVIYPSESKNLQIGNWDGIILVQSAASLVPVDKLNEDPITVPIERLIKIPSPGIP
ncbi:Integrase catalytic domain-containing protein [Meloidogyne graminicola]|uniref:Integrase catalytic domain-containing protein n=1 Tax=Meloidogyne graminicola TaxID=189291 RepID=A0A8S9ZYL8_9BILA|nr:Integrase catalytic domain-containing protein [Meloidogyne graminicola]